MTTYRFKKPKASLLREQISDEIRQAILTGKLKPGDKLREVDIAEQMGVSRSSVREALLLLKQEGLVVSRPYKDTIVTQYSEKEVQEVLIPIRLTLEIFAARNGIRKLTEHDIATFSSYIHAMKTAAESDNPNTDESKTIVLENDIAFHSHLVHMCDFENIHVIWTSIINPIRLYFIQLKTYEDLYKLQWTEHQILLDSFMEGDQDKMEEALRRHIRGEYMLDKLGEKFPYS